MSLYGWNFKGEKHLGKDLSIKFQEFMSEKSLPKNAFYYVYLLIPGLFANSYGNKYMQNNIEYMKELGLDIRKVDINTDATVEENADTIRDYILSQDKKLIIMGHSKGGIDVGTAIAKYDLYDRIKCLIMLQVPWSGSQFAEEIEYQGLITSFFNLTSNILTMNKTAIADLKYVERKRMIKKYKLDIDKIRVISVYSLLENKKSLLYPFYSLLKKKYDIESDGIVGKEDALIPGSDYIKIDNLDHSNSVFMFGNPQPGQITHALILTSLNL